MPPSVFLNWREEQRLSLSIGFICPSWTCVRRMRDLPKRGGPLDCRYVHCLMQTKRSFCTVAVAWGEREPWLHSFLLSAGCRRRTPSPRSARRGQGLSKRTLNLSMCGRSDHDDHAATLGFVADLGVHYSNALAQLACKSRTDHQPGEPRGYWRPYLPNRQINSAC